MSARAVGSDDIPHDVTIPRWHTALLVLLIVSVSVSGLLLAGGAPALAGSRITSVYLPLLLVQTGLAAYVSWPFLRAHAAWALFGAARPGAARIAADVALGLLAAAAIEACEWGLAQQFGVRRNVAAAAILPVGGAERAAWALLALAVGVCEELVYRGYLQRQLRALCGRASVAIVLQAALFGLAHAEQGAAAAARVAVYGCVLGVLTRWRASLLAPIVAHVSLDLASGLL